MRGGRKRGRHMPPFWRGLVEGRWSRGQGENLEFVMDNWATVNLLNIGLEKVPIQTRSRLTNFLLAHCHIDNELQLSHLASLIWTCTNYTVST